MAKNESKMIFNSVITGESPWDEQRISLHQHEDEGLVAFFLMMVKFGEVQAVDITLQGLISLKDVLNGIDLPSLNTSQTVEA